MKQEVKGVVIVCDCCGERYMNEEGFVCYVGDEDGSQIWNDADNHEWLEFCDRHYCPDCYSFDKDDENIVITKDGHKYNWETDEEIASPRKEDKMSKTLGQRLNDLNIEVGTAITTDWQHYRIQASIAAMQSIADSLGSIDYNKELIAKHAVELADALIAELQKKQD